MSCWLFRTRSAHEGWQPPLSCALHPPIPSQQDYPMVLADQPYVPGVVLGKESELWLAELSCGVIPLRDNQSPHAVDHLAQIGDGCDNATRLATLLVHDGRPLVDELRPRFQG